MSCLAYLLGKFLPPLIMQYTLTLRHNLENIYHKVRTRMGQKQSRQKELYDQKTKGAPFKTDDLIGYFAQLFPGESPLSLAGIIQGYEADQ